jgi:hypothetical protein
MLALPSYSPSSARSSSGLTSLKFLSFLLSAFFLPNTSLPHQSHFVSPSIGSFSRRQPLSTHLADQCPVTDSRPIRYGSLADIWYLCNLVESGEPASRSRSTLASELSSAEVTPNCSPAACRGSTRTLIADTIELFAEKFPPSD